MAEVEGQEKTEQPTAKKLSDGRKKGQVGKSQELNSLAVFATGLLLVFITQQLLSGNLGKLTVGIFDSLDILTINRDNTQEIFIGWFYSFISIIGPVLAGVFFAALIAGISQVGLKFGWQVFQPKLSKFNPIKGVKNLFFSSRSFVELLKSVAKFIIVGGFTYIVLDDLIMESTQLVNLTVSETVDFMIDASISLIWKISLIYVVIAAVDFIFQKYKFKKDMMMTKQEVKEENKQSEGDPLIKSRIKRAQVQLSTNRMIQELPKADVVITNPTHFAVALKYDMEKDSAPKVIAKGVDQLAQRIKKIAAENDIPLHEDRELARALYKMCDVGESIPENLFKAVAQILAYVYQLKNNYKKKFIV